MALPAIGYAGHVVYEQPAEEFRRERRDNVAFATIIAVGGVVCLAIAVYEPLYSREPHGEFRVLIGAVGLALLVVGPLSVISWRGVRPYRLYAEGILTPMGEFFPYAGFIDAYLLPPVRTKTPVFLQLTGRDGRAIFIGGLRSKYAAIHARDFDHVSRLVMEGIRSRGYKSGITWTEGARKTLEVAAISRGEIMIDLEAMALRSGVREIDEAFVRRAASDPNVARSFAWRAIRKRLP